MELYSDSMIERDTAVRQKLQPIKIKIEDVKFMINKHRAELSANPKNEQIKIDIGLAEFLLAGLEIVFQHERKEAIAKRRSQLAKNT